jgi:hypothetical protein
MNHLRRDTTTTPGDPTRVTVDDLARIGALQSLLSTLNDPRAGADVLARHIAAMPVLQARVESRFSQHYQNLRKHGLAQQIALLGNRQLEGILLELLEDLVMLHSDIEPSKRYTF